MRNLLSQKPAAGRLLGLSVLAVSMGLTFALPGDGQMTPEEHAKHHPEQAKEKDKGGTPPKTEDGKEPAKGAGGGMGGGMDMAKMMEKMGKAPPKDLYPTLMSFSELTPAQREEVQSQAQERMRSGVALLSTGLDRLGKTAENEDFLAMQEATNQMREGLAQFESGLAARRALLEGTPPRQVALQWFKGEMNLQPPQGIETRGGGLFGLTLFHLFTMVLLIAFSLAMVAMYFFKMRRAAALFGRIESAPGSPPPGSAPSLAGTAPPPATSIPGTPA